jgi:GNAT superfamily N-acetyltransferase
MIFREIATNDISNLLELRSKTDENNISSERLVELGITYETVKAKLNSSYRGWLCEIACETVGFAIGDRKTGELWVIAVHPEHLKKGIGGHLLKMVEDWLFDANCKKLWLTTDIDTSLRAYSFYINRGWKDDFFKHGLRYMYKVNN